MGSSACTLGLLRLSAGVRKLFLADIPAGVRCDTGGNREFGTRRATRAPCIYLTDEKSEEDRRSELRARGTGAARGEGESPEPQGNININKLFIVTRSRRRWLWFVKN